MIEQIENLYRDGKQTFVVMTHDYPDPDAAAGMLGMKHLLQLVLPKQAQVRLMSIGHIGGEYSNNGRFVTEGIEKIFDLYGTPVGARQSALILVDQPTINCSRVLPNEIRRSEKLFLPPEADIILDHHRGIDTQSAGVVSVGIAGSTSALLLRALQLASERRGLNERESDWYKDTTLALLLNTGAWTDACIPLSLWGSPEGLPDVVRWVHEQTKSRLDASQVKDFDLSPCFREFYLNASKTWTICGPIVVDGRSCNVILAFVGLVRDPNQLGAFASEYMREQINLAPQDLPFALAVFGVIRSTDANLENIFPNESIRVSIRRHGDVCSDRIGKLLSEVAGGGEASAVADLNVAPGSQAHQKDTFVGSCLRYLEAKLKGDTSLGGGGELFVDSRQTKKMG